jgi:antitoxin (DNA-binding transcriptional repressor) of toxin-antitoxin stability system
MTTVSIEEAARKLPELLQRAQTESVYIRDDQGISTLLVSFRPRTDAERQQAIARMQELAEEASAELELSLAKDGIAVEEFLADALADV